jgi:Ser/Thr protein kinase RdoA (MazF antagonist)
MRTVIDTLTAAGECATADDIVALWAHDTGSTRFLRASANFVCTFRRDNQPQVLRFTHAGERTQALLQAEIDYLHHLSACGVPVARPIRALSGRELESVQTPLGAFHAVAFEALAGAQYDIEELTLEQFSSWGRALGQLHLAARSYTGSGRPSWRDRLTALAERLPPDEQAARTVLDQVSARVAGLPAQEHNYGLIHGDFELDNLIWEADSVGIVDFDDSAWNWYVADIAFALRDLFGDRADNVDWGHEALLAFIDGYRTRCDVAQADLRLIPLFLQMHNVITFGKLLRTLDIPGDEPVPEWLGVLQQKLVRKLEFYRERFAAYAVL